MTSLRYAEKYGYGSICIESKTREMPIAILLNDNLYEKNLYPTDIGDENFTWRIEYAYNSKKEQDSAFKLNSQWNLYYKTVNDKKKFIFDQYLHYYKKKMIK